MQESGGPITHDMNSPEIYGTVFSLAPGKKDRNLIWAGSDDGLVHVTRDDGKTWTNVTPRDMPDFGRVSQLDGSSFDNGTAYMAVKKMLLGDRSPYIFRTQRLRQDLDEDRQRHSRQRLRAHRARRRRRAAGCSTPARSTASTSRSTTASSGRSSTTACRDVPVTDLVVEDNALAIGTHGRSFYVMDDIAALRQFGLAPLDRRDAVQAGERDPRSRSRRRITYFLKSQPKA